MTALESKAGQLSGSRTATLGLILAAGAWAAWWLGLTPASVWPSSEELGAVGRFLAYALTPALDYEGAFTPADAPPLLIKALDGARRTVVFATAAMSLAVVAGLLLGFLGSAAWWADDLSDKRRGPLALARRSAGPLIYTSTRILIALMRSVHVLLWAVLFLAAMGLTDLGAVVAIAIPYAGVLAKVFSEMIDETPRDAAQALRAAGARPSQVFTFGLVSRAGPDMAAYTCYRFECALRSSAILGFFGPQTLGTFIKQSWNENHYGEVWTYLYVLFALIALVDWWSGALRRRFVA